LVTFLLRQDPRFVALHTSYLLNTKGPVYYPQLVVENDLTISGLHSAQRHVRTKDGSMPVSISYYSCFMFRTRMDKFFYKGSESKYLDLWANDLCGNLPLLL
jgi:hypothetical protein